MPFPCDSSSTWKQAYECVILELDGNKLPSRVAETGCAIRDRAEEILTCSSLAEHHALNNALHTLRSLRKRLPEKNPRPNQFRQLLADNTPRMLRARTAFVHEARYYGCLRAWRIGVMVEMPAMAIFEGSA